MYIPGIGYISSPQDLLQNEWVVFIGVFLLVFAVVYIGLAGFFIKSDKQTAFEKLMELKAKKNGEKGPLVVIAAVISLFTSAAVARGDIIYQYFGAVLGTWILVFVLIVMFMLLIPFYRAFKNSVGKTFAMLLMILFFWFSIKLFFPDLLYSGYYSFSNYFYQIEQFYLTVSQTWFLIVALIVGFFASKLIRD